MGSNQNEEDIMSITKLLDSFQCKNYSEVEDSLQANVAIDAIIKYFSEKLDGHVHFDLRASSLLLVAAIVTRCQRKLRELANLYSRMLTGFLEHHNIKFDENFEFFQLGIVLTSLVGRFGSVYIFQRLVIDAPISRVGLPSENSKKLSIKIQSIEQVLLLVSFWCECFHGLRTQLSSIKSYESLLWNISESIDGVEGWHMCVDSICEAWLVTLKQASPERIYFSKLLDQILDWLQAFVHLSSQSTTLSVEVASSSAAVPPVKRIDFSTFHIRELILTLAYEDINTCDYLVRGLDRICDSTLSTFCIKKHVTQQDVKLLCFLFEVYTIAASEYEISGNSININYIFEYVENSCIVDVLLAGVIHQLIKFPSKMPIFFFNFYEKLGLVLADNYSQSRGKRKRNEDFMKEDSGVSINQLKMQHVSSSCGTDSKCATDLLVDLLASYDVFAELPNLKSKDSALVLMGFATLELVVVYFSDLKCEAKSIRASVIVDLWKNAIQVLVKAELFPYLLCSIGRLAEAATNLKLVKRLKPDCLLLTLLTQPCISDMLLRESTTDTALQHVTEELIGMSSLRNWDASIASQYLRIAAVFNCLEISQFSQHISRRKPFLKKNIWKHLVAFIESVGGMRRILPLDVDFISSLVSKCWILCPLATAAETSNLIGLEELNCINVMTDASLRHISNQFSEHIPFPLMYCGNQDSFLSQQEKFVSDLRCGNHSLEFCWMAQLTQQLGLWEAANSVIVTEAVKLKEVLNSFLKLVAPNLRQLWENISYSFRRLHNNSTDSINIISKYFDAMVNIRCLACVSQYVCSDDQTVGSTIGHDMDAIFSSIVLFKKSDSLSSDPTLPWMNEILTRSFYCRMSCASLVAFDLVESMVQDRDSYVLDLLTNLSPSLPGSQIIITAMAASIRCCHLTCPKNSIRMLGRLVQAWAKTNVSSDIVNLSLIYCEVYSLLRDGVLSALFLSLPEDFVRHLYLSLLQSKEILAESILVLNSLTVLMVQSYGQSFSSDLASVLLSEAVILRGLNNRFSSYFPSHELLDALSQVVEIRQLSAPTLDFFPRSLYHLLLSISSRSGFEVAECFHEFKRIFLLSNIFDSSGPLQAIPFSAATFQHVMLQLIWDLGSIDINFRATTLKAIKIFCLLLIELPWFQEDESNQECISAIRDHFSPSILFSNNFLYIVANLTQRRSLDLSQTQDAQAIRSLHEIIAILPAEHLAKYLPKIMTILDTALSHTSPRVRYCTALLLKLLCERLPFQTLLMNIHIVTGCVFPILENQNKLEQKEVAVSRSIGDLKALISITLTYRLSVPGLLEVAGMPCWLSKAFEHMHVQSFDKYWDIQSKEIIVQLLTKLFSDNKHENESSMKLVAFVPPFPGLEVVSLVVKQVFEAQTQSEQLARVLELLSNESLYIRKMGLNRLRIMLQDADHKFHAVLLGLNDSTIGGDQIVGVVTQLLRICSRDDGPLLTLCGSCLGLIGAIDPGVFSKFDVSIIQRSERTTQTPMWERNGVEFGLYLLQSFLVPSLRSSAHTQDRCGFAIQSILKTLAEDASILEQSNLLACRVSHLKRKSLEDNSSMPANLRALLTKAEIIDVVEPYWYTRYDIKEVAAVKNPPLFDTSISFTRWIGSWVNYLGVQCVGHYCEYFSACKGAIRTLSALSQFLLPYMIVDILGQSVQASRKESSKITQVADSIVSEIILVLQGNQHQKQESNTEANGAQALAIQAVFELLDVLAVWLHHSPVRSNNSNNSSSFSTLCDKDTQLEIKRLIDSIPMHLLWLAALRIKAFGRAIRYFEIFVRQNHHHMLSRKAVSDVPGTPRSRAVTKVDRNDGSNGGLPLLSEEEFSYLLTISSKLGIVDSVHGVQTLLLMTGHSLNYRCRILDFEQRDDWMRALGEYNSLLRLQNHAKSYVQDGSGKDRLLQAVADLGEYAQLETIEQGRLRCLIELGQLESAIDHAATSIATHSDIEAAVSHLGAEAAWRLMNWDSLNSFLSSNRSASLEPDAAFQINLGSLFLDLHRHCSHQDDSKLQFRGHINRFRRDVMVCLASASKESYDRAYPYLIQLHLLQDMEFAFEFASESTENNQGKQQIDLTEMLSPERIEILSPDPHFRSMCMAVRRSIFGILNRPKLVAQNWLVIAEESRKLSRFDAAEIALRNAELWGLCCRGGNFENAVLFNECLLLSDAGKTSKALELVEPVEIDASALRKILHSPSVSAEARQEAIDKFHIATKLMVGGKQRLGRILERFELLAEEQNSNEEVHYEYGLYCERLFEDAKQRELSETSASAASSPRSLSSSSSSSRTGVAALEDMRLLQSQAAMEDHSSNYAKIAIVSYCKCLAAGKKLTAQVLPRMLTLWFGFTSLRELDGRAAGSSSSSSRPAAVSALSLAQKAVNQVVLEHHNKIPVESWYICLPQLVSMLRHSNSDTRSIINNVLEKVLITFPAHSIWHVACLLKSANPDRHKAGNRLVERCIAVLNKIRRTADAEMLRDSLALFNDLVRLAEEQSADKKIRFPIGKGINLARFLVPTQDVLVNPPSELTQSLHRQQNISPHFRSGQMFIREFNEIVDVASSKARPKTLSLITTSGVTVRFLSKQEKDGDLRKDSRLMEFNGVINRLLAANAEGRRRCLRLRTYAVVCLNEECGILEWVEHTKCMRHLITEVYKFWPDPAFTVPNMKEIMQLLPDMQNRNKLDVVTLSAEYQERIAKKYKPCFHRWFLYNFEDPTRWLEARTRFCRSAAVWSVVGHVIGLGDRHTENILLDYRSGECVHVDFDCLFDKGLTLQKPEIVPFRLTPNMVDAMGLTGIEGVFKCTMEVCLAVLRDNKDALLSVIEPFLRDPTVNWKRSGRAQRNESSNPRVCAMNSEQENSDAKAMLATINDRLSGIYNIVHPHAEALNKAHLSRTNKQLTKGIGSYRRQELALSVEGQVQRLIEEAISVENLSQMFLGWMPWV